MNLTFGKCSKTQFGAVTLDELERRRRTIARDGVKPMKLRDNTTGNEFETEDFESLYSMPPSIKINGKVYQAQLQPGKTPQDEWKIVFPQLDMIG